MALVLKGGAVFLHIPKTGGNWVTRVLQQNGLVQTSLGPHKHATPDRLLVPISRRGGIVGDWVTWWRRKRWLDPKPFMFCFVRHPLAWYESWFKYISQPRMNWRDFGSESDLFDWHPNAVLNGCQADDFNAFVRNVVEKRPGFVTELYAAYAQPHVDFVGKQERLALDLTEVLTRLGLPFDREAIENAEAIGVSPAPKDALVWDAGLKAEVLALEQVAMVRYGYEEASDGVC